VWTPLAREAPLPFAALGAEWAEASPEGQPDRELEGEQSQEPFLPGEYGNQRERPDHGLVRARTAAIDDVEVLVGGRRSSVSSTDDYSHTSAAGKKNLTLGGRP
jgi:hypothetical protein